MYKPSEFEIQAEAYHNIKEVYPKTRGEYLIKKDKANGIRGARFDIVIFDAIGEMKLIIEVKRFPYGERETQGKRYTELTGVPCIYLRGMKDAENAVNIINTYLEENGITID